MPYITGISTELSEGNKKRPTVLSRSALGVYPVRRGSNITVEGYNLNGTSSRVQIGTQEYTPITGTTTNSLVITTDANTTSSGIVAKTGNITSLNNQTAKSITTGTGENAVTRIIDYNAEPNEQNNDLLTDKREIRVVDVTTTTNTTDKRMLDMAINGNELYFSAGYSSDYFATMRANGTNIDTIKLLRNSFTRYFDNAIAISGNTIYTVSACGDSYNPVTTWNNGPSHFALSKGDPGTSINEYSGTDTNNNTNLLFLESNWNGANLNNLDRFKLPNLVVSGNNGYISYYDTTQKLIKFRYFTTAQNKVASNYDIYTGGSKELSQRGFEGTANTNTTYSQSYIAIAGADENSTYSVTGVTPNNEAIIAWYDATNGALMMKYNTSPATSFSGYQEFKTVPTGKKLIGNFNFTYNRNYSLFYTNTNELDGKSARINNNYYILEYKGAANGNQYYAINNYNNTNNLSDIGVYEDVGQCSFDLSVDGRPAQNITVAGNILSGGDAKHEFAYQLNLILSNGYGSYAEVDPKTNLVTVRSMQTGINSKIAITNLKSGNTNLNQDTYLNTAVAGAGSHWNEVTIDDDSAGQYVAMKTDAKGGIHFAYYDTGNGDLKYAYMSSVTATPIVVTVDGYQQVGQYVDLALKETTVGNTTSVTPYISYYSMSNADTKRSAKVAKLASPITYNGATANASSVKDGSVDELFTGAWEAYHVPTAGIPVQYRVNIGVTSAGNVYISYLADRIIEYVKVE